MTKLPRPAYELWKLPRKEKKAFCKKYGNCTYLFYKKRKREELKRRCQYLPPPTLNEAQRKLCAHLDKIMNLGSAERDTALYYFGY